MRALHRIHQLLHGERRWVVPAVLLAVVASLLGLGQPLVVKQAIDRAGHGPLPWGLLAGLVALFVGQAVVRSLGDFLLERTSERLVLRIRLELIAALLRLRISEYDRHRRGDLMARVNSDTTVLRSSITRVIVDLFAGLVGSIGVIGLMIWLDWQLFTVVAVMVTISAVLVARVLPALKSAALHTQQGVGGMEADLERVLAAIRTVRASNAEERELARVGGQAQAAYTAGLRTAKLEATTGPAIELTVQGTFLVVLVVGGIRVASGAGSVSQLVAFLLYLTSLVPPLGALLQAASTLQRGLGALHRIDEVLALPRDETAPAAGRPAPAPGPGAPALRFDDIWFSYRTEPVLRGVSFEVARHDFVAVVGPSGAGKSTLLALAEGFHQPDRGAVLSGGHDLRTLNLRTYRAQVGLVEQHTPVMYGSLRENLRYAHPQADDETIARAVRLARLDGLVRRLPDGLDTSVGEHGATLSGGEQQRLAIARALVGDPRILLLDEPTSQLDPENEAALTRTLVELSTQRAVLVVAHRLSTIRQARTIVVLDHGRVTACGTHRELLVHDPGYRRMLAHSTGVAADGHWDNARDGANSLLPPLPTHGHAPKTLHP